MISMFFEFSATHNDSDLRLTQDSDDLFPILSRVHHDLCNFDTNAIFFDFEVRFRPITQAMEMELADIGGLEV